MDRNTVMHALRRSPLFGSLSDASLDALIDRSAVRTPAAGDRVFSEGDEGLSAFVVIRGGVRINVRLTVLTVLEAGQVFGEMAVIDGTPRSAAAVAETDSVLLEIGREAFLETIGADPSALGALLREMGRRLRETSGRLSAAERFIEAIRPEHEHRRRAAP